MKIYNISREGILTPSHSAVKEADSSARAPKYSIALGRFDGVHTAHRALIKRAAETAKGLNIKSAVFTFSDAPSRGSLTLLSEKLEIFQALGIDSVFLSSLDEIKNLSPEEFVQSILCKIGCENAVCGFNFTFGRGKSGTPELLSELGKKHGFSLDVLPPLEIGGEVVSSTLVRSLVLKGELERAGRLLEVPYSIKGSVCRGFEKGRTIGFPTLNIPYPALKAEIKEGVYATLCQIDGREYPSVTNVGHNPTLYKKELTTETYLIDESGNYYGKDAKVGFLKFIRGQVHCSSFEELSLYIRDDIEKAKEYHYKANKTKPNK